MARKLAQTRACRCFASFGSSVPLPLRMCCQNRSAASARSGVVSSKGSRTARAAPMAGRSRIQSWCLCCPSRRCRCTPSGYSWMIVSPGHASGWNSNVEGAVSNSAGARMIVVARTSGDQNTAWRSAPISGSTQKRQPPAPGGTGQGLRAGAEGPHSISLRKIVPIIGIAAQKLPGEARCINIR